jgi:hypothetical protein
MSLCKGKAAKSGRKQHIDKSKEEIKGIIENNLKEFESGVKDIKNVICTAGRMTTQTTNQTTKRNKN